MFFIFDKFISKKELKKEVSEKENSVKSTRNPGIDFFEGRKRHDEKLQGYHALDKYKEYLNDGYDETEAQEEVCYDTANYIDAQMRGELTSGEIDELAEYLGSVADEIDMWNKI